MSAHGTRRVEHNLVLAEPLRVLTLEQVQQVDRALASIGPFGEVRLVKVKGRLRFIQQLESRDLLQGGGVRQEE